MNISSLKNNIHWKNVKDESGKLENKKVNIFCISYN